MRNFLGFVLLGGVAAFAAPSAMHGLKIPAIFERAAPIAAVPQSPGLTICRGGNRAERKVSCIVDGDTGWFNGVKWRLTTGAGGVDTPEISKPECAAEAAIGAAARDRLLALMAGGYAIALGDSDQYGRALSVIKLADGRDAGQVLIEEGLAQPWPNTGNVWCGR